MKADLVIRFVLGLLALVVLAVAGLLFYHLYQVPRWGLHYEANSGWVLLVEQDSNAATAGLRVGDTITQIGLLPLHSNLEPLHCTVSNGQDCILPVSLRRAGNRTVLWMASNGKRIRPPGF
jgi:hypothetical protein